MSADAQHAGKCMSHAPAMPRNAQPQRACSMQARCVVFLAEAA